MNCFIFFMTYLFAHLLSLRIFSAFIYIRFYSIFSAGLRLCSHFHSLSFFPTFSPLKPQPRFLCCYLLCLSEMLSVAIFSQKLVCLSSLRLSSYILTLYTSFSTLFPLAADISFSLLFFAFHILCDSVLQRQRDFLSK